MNRFVTYSLVGLISGVIGFLVWCWADGRIGSKKVKIRKMFR